jgi:hypothetical protein
MSDTNGLQVFSAARYSPGYFFFFLFCFVLVPVPVGDGATPRLFVFCAIAIAQKARRCNEGSFPSSTA